MIPLQFFVDRRWKTRAMKSVRGAFRVLWGVVVVVTVVHGSAGICSL